MATIEGISCCSDSFECLFKVLIYSNIIVCVLLVCLHGFYNKGLLKSIINILYTSCSVLVINVSTGIMHSIV